MGWFSKGQGIRITNPVRGQLQVVACSPFPDAAGEVILYPRCDIDGVITAERLASTAVQYSSYDVPKPKWPNPGTVLPVTVDLADPNRFRIEWDQAPTGAEAAERLAESLRAQQLSEQPAAQDHQLMSKRCVLSFKPQPRLEWRGQDGQHETETPDHLASLSDSVTSSTKTRFSVHTAS